MTQYSFMTLRMKVVAVIIVLLFAYDLAVLYGVQIIRHDELFEKAKKTYTSVKKTSGTRGEIFDYDGNLLVGNDPAFDVIGDPSIIGGEEACRTAANVIAGDDADSETREKIFRKLMDKEFVSVDKTTGRKTTRKRKYVVLARTVEYEKGKEMRKSLAELKIKGISFVNTYKRRYPKDELLSNVLGFTRLDDRDIIAEAGIEKTYDEVISSQEGKEVFEHGRDGHLMSYGLIKRDEIKDGSDVCLTIREPIQAILEDELDKVYAEMKPKAAYAIVADPYTGDILAIAQRPTFNPNDRSTMTPEAFRNRAAEDVFEPGSIMKPFVISKAIDDGTVTPDTMIDCEPGKWFFAGKILNDSHKIGLVPVSEVIKQSSNIGTAKIAIMLGNEKTYDILTKFGYGTKTNLFRIESRGIFAHYSKWKKIHISRIPMGQGICVTPLQVVRAYCTLANGGYPVELRLVDRVENEDGIKKMPYKRGKCIFENPNTANTMTTMLKRVTEPGGTALAAAVKEYHVAGKTGTSEKVEGGQYVKKYFTSFCGYVPAENPRLVIFVTCDEPSVSKNDAYGGKVAGPAFAAIAERSLKYLRVEPTMSLEAWKAERKVYWNKEIEKRRKQDEAVRLNRLKRDGKIK